MCNGLKSRSLMIFTLWYFKHSICAFHILPFGFSHSQGSNRLKYLVWKRTSGERRVGRVSRKVWRYSPTCTKDTSPSDSQVILGNETPCPTPQKKKKGLRKMTLINGLSQTAGTFMGHWTVWKHNSCLWGRNIEVFISINCTLYFTLTSPQQRYETVNRHQ